VLNSFWCPLRLDWIWDQVTCALVSLAIALNSGSSNLCSLVEKFLWLPFAPPLVTSLVSCILNDIRFNGRSLHYIFLNYIYRCEHMRGQKWTKFKRSNKQKYYIPFLKGCVYKLYSLRLKILAVLTLEFYVYIDNESRHIYETHTLGIVWI
jgi:hypothetical protein